MKLHSFFESLRELRHFLLLFTTQALSSLGSAMTSYALVIWAYQQSGSALSTALLTVSSYAPYVVFSLFCGALVDRLDTRRTMLVSDALVACTTVAALVLLQTGRLQITHLYLLNALNGLMNTLQQPASEAATTALLPKSQYQRVGGLRYLSSSLSGLLTPVLAMALMMLGGLRGHVRGFGDIRRRVHGAAVLHPYSEAANWQSARILPRFDPAGAAVLPPSARAADARAVPRGD